MWRKEWFMYFFGICTYFVILFVLYLYQQIRFVIQWLQISKPTSKDTVTRQQMINKITFLMIIHLPAEVQYVLQTSSTPQWPFLEPPWLYLISIIQPLEFTAAKTMLHCDAPIWLIRLISSSRIQKAYHPIVCFSD